MSTFITKMTSLLSNPAPLLILSQPTALSGSRDGTPLWTLQSLDLQANKLIHLNGETDEAGQSVGGKKRKRASLKSPSRIPTAGKRR